MFLFASLLPAFVGFLGLKAMLTGEIQLSADRKLGRNASIVIGLIALLGAIGTIVFCFAFLVLRLF